MKTQEVETSDQSNLVQDPLVSVLMITYNHAEYLADAIEGVINQKCAFLFELIIGEDASLDATRQIALEYQKRYPNIIRVIHSTKNVGMNKNSHRIFEKARGKYIAYCEGDDFWCDSNKLSQQVKLIESDPEINIVHSDWTHAHLKSNKWIYDFKKSVHRRVSSKYLAGDLSKTWHHPKILRTCTIMLRKSSIAEWYASGLMNSKYHFGDSVLSSWITAQGQVAYLPAVTAVYRVSPNSALRLGSAARVALYRSALMFDSAAQRFFASMRQYYSKGYRWDTIAGLIVWGLRAGDWSAVKDGFNDFRKNFNLLEFIIIGWQNFVMRLPALKRQHRAIPNNKPYGISEP